MSCVFRTHSCILVDLKARSAKGARFSAVHPRGGTSRCSNVCLWRTFAKKCPGRKPIFAPFYNMYKTVQIGVSARGIFSQKCAIDRHLSTEKFPLWGGLLKSEHLWLNVLLNPPKYTNGFGTCGSPQAGQCWAIESDRSHTCTFGSEYARVSHTRDRNAEPRCVFPSCGNWHFCKLCEKRASGAPHIRRPSSVDHACHHVVARRRWGARAADNVCSLCKRLYSVQEYRIGAPVNCLCNVLHWARVFISLVRVNVESFTERRVVYS